MKLTGWIAFRYLKSKKSHGAVSAIATVSIAGVAIATAAVVCVLSVFNGFRFFLEDKFDSMNPDIVISSVKGKVIANPAEAVSRLESVPGIATVTPVVTDKALAIFGGQELPVTIKGVDPEAMSSTTRLKSTILPGGKLPESTYQEIPQFEYAEDYEEFMATHVTPQALPSIGAATRLGNMEVGNSFLLFAPSRTERYNPAAPYESFVTDSVQVTGIFQTRQKEFDEDMVIVPIDLARHLFQYDNGEASSLEVSVAPSASLPEVKDRVQKALGPSFRVRDRAEMQEVNFRMINIEKWVSFLLLVFILMIAGFNIISTMTMLVLEKRRQISVMNALGMRKWSIGGVFRNESVMVSLIGGVIGILLGLLLCWLQQEYGLIKLAGDPTKLLMKVYPVRIVWTDVALAFVPCVVLGFITALIAGSFARSRISRSGAGA